MNRLVEEPRTGSGWGRLHEIEDRIFTGRRLQLYGLGVPVAYAIALAWRIFHGQSIFHSDGRLRCVDFGWMWLSGKFAASGDLARIFDYPAFAGAQLALFGPDNCPLIPHFYYPPTFLFILFPLGFMPYLIAFVVWNLVTLLFYLGAVYAIVPRRAALFAALTPFFVPVNIDFGHNGFVTAALVGFSLVFAEKRPWLSAPFLGLLTYKPQLGLLFPPALLVARNWRALAGAMATTGLLAGGATLAFGEQGWLSFIDAMLTRNSVWSPDGTTELNVQSVLGLLHHAGVSASIAWTVQLVVAAFVGLTVCALWSKPVPYPLKAAALCLGSVTVTPYALFYDLCVLAIAVAFFIKDALTRGFLPGERTIILVCWAGLFLARTPVGPIVCAALLFLTARRIVAYRRDLVAPASDAQVGLALGRSR
jgi:hypothetical protein